MSKAVLLHGGSLSATAFMQKSDIEKQSILGMLYFSEVSPLLSLSSNRPCAYVPMKNLDEGGAVCELWLSHRQLIHGDAGAIHYQHDGEILFGVISFSESEFQATIDKTPLQQATEAAYSEIFDLIEALQYPHLFRFWNYIADINTVSYELERYWQFNIGRHDAFVAAKQEVIGSVPAACALGFNGYQQATLTIAFMAGRVKPIAIENPRQISAYEYPRQYGPISPTFSRAVLINLKDSELLLISGTASIVGHATQHESDVTVQTRETMVNFAAILEEANRFTRQAKFSVSDLHYRVYVRHPENLTLVQAEMTRFLGQSPNAVYLQADICRQDLLLEIEATTESPLSSFYIDDVGE
jgi:chorismate lyase / 3-hydroxybenzoate synthase